VIKNGFFVFVLLALSCQPRARRSLAIRELPSALQPYLLSAVSTGIVGHDNYTLYIQQHATDKELKLIAESELPILRAIALGEMLQRRSFDHFTVMMEHLDDTAVIAMDAGEWGVWLRKVSDYMITEGRWRTKTDRARTFDDIILHHDYLRAAYTGLMGDTALPAAYYPHIRAMAQRDVDFEERELALYALARYRKREDIPLIKEAIETTHGWRMTSQSFDLIRNFPDTAYLPVLQEFYPRRFYRTVCRSVGVSWGEDYIRTVAAYKTDSSASILAAIIDRKPFLPCTADTSALRYALLTAIWENRCVAYSSLMRQTSEEMKRYRRQDSIDAAGRMHDEIDPIDKPYKDTAAEPVRW
jgi:hypothetical protein